MKKFQVVIMVAFAFLMMPAVTGACDGLLGRVAGRLEGKVVGFGLIRNITKTGKYATKPTTTVVVVQSTGKMAIPAPPVSAVPKPMPKKS